MNIDFDSAKQRFVIRCPIWANELVQRLPSRRWNKTERAWTAPLLRQNVGPLRELTRLGGAKTTPAAVKALDTYERKAEQVAAKGEFPAWYPFKRQPRKHQTEALNKGYGLNYFALFMDMQTGKSKTTVDLAAAHRMEGHLQGGLVFTKLSLRRNWIGHFEKDCPIPFSIHLPDTGEKFRFNRWLGASHDFKIMVVGWESLSAGGMRDMCKHFMKSMLHSFCAGDETTFITSHKAIRSKEAVEIGHMADYRYALTGTPALEGPMNLYMQFEFLDPDIIGIGDFYAYRNRYAVMGGYHREVRPGVKQPTEIIGYQNLPELMKLITPYVHQVTKADAYDLPPKRYQQRTVQLTKPQQEIYQKIVKDQAYTLKGGTEHVIENILEVSLRLHQVAGGYAVNPRTYLKVKRDGTEVAKKAYDPVELITPDKNPKMLEVCAILEETRKKKQGIIWVVYQPEIRAIVGLMRKMGLAVGELHGGVREADRQPMVDEFEKGGIDWVVGNASTGGMGFTMMASEVNVFYNNTFKAIDRVQAEDRAYGDGQTKSGIWIDITAEGTIDNTILQALAVKQDLADFIRRAIKHVGAGLDLGALLTGEYRG